MNIGSRQDVNLLTRMGGTDVYSGFFQGLLPKDVNRHQYRAGQHETTRPGLGNQIAGKADAEPHHADGVDLALEGNAIAGQIVANPWAKSFVIDQPMIEAWRASGEAGRCQQQEGGCGQDREENPDHSQNHAYPPNC